MLGSWFYRNWGTISYFSKIHGPKNVSVVLKNMYFSGAFVTVSKLIKIENKN